MHCLIIISVNFSVTYICVHFVAWWLFGHPQTSPGLVNDICDFERQDAPRWIWCTALDGQKYPDSAVRIFRGVLMNRVRVALTAVCAWLDEDFCHGTEGALRSSDWPSSTILTSEWGVVAAAYEWGAAGFTLIFVFAHHKQHIRYYITICWLPTNKTIIDKTATPIAAIAGWIAPSRQV